MEVSAQANIAHTVVKKQANDEIQDAVAGEEHKEDPEDNVFLITTFHPSDHTVREIVHKNWDILGQNDETNFLYKKRLITGYRRPKNLRDHLVNSNIPRAEEDDQVDPWAAERRAETAPPLQQEAITPTINKKQKRITDFYTRQSSALEVIEEETGGSTTTPQRTPTTNTLTPRRGTDPKHRGFNFCGAKRHCRFCPFLNKTGKITSHITGKEHVCMNNISCRSSNLIYCISCTKCGSQYVGQTLLRVRDRFEGHLGDINRGNMLKSVSRHMCTFGHNGNADMTISVLEFIKKAPRSPAALIIRNRVERKWIHLLRTMAPQGMNLED